jgi:hypothetical protein
MHGAVMLKTTTRRRDAGYDARSKQAATYNW